MTEKPSVLTKNDVELVQLALQDANQFLHIMNKYQAPLLRYINRVSNFGNEESEDILQEVFIKVYKNLNGYDNKLKFSSWIYRITHNEVISHFRKSKSRPMCANCFVDDSFLENIAGEFNLTKNLENDLNKKNIIAVFDLMDEKYKQVLILKYLEEKDYNEISDILKRPKGTVAIWLSRAKKQFVDIAIKQKINLK